jgi:transposase
MTAKVKKAPVKPKAEVAKNVGGRPTELTPENEEKLLELIRAGIPIKTAAVTIGIEERTFYHWMKRGGDEQYRINKGEKSKESEAKFFHFFQSVTRAKEEAKAGHVAVISKAGKAGDWRASAWWLQRQFRDEFGDNPAPQNVTNNIHNTLNISTTMSELQTLIAEVKESRTRELDAPSD